MPAKTPIDSRVWQRPYLAECTPNDFDLIPKAHIFKSSCNCFYNLRQRSSLQGMGLGFVGWGWGGGWGGSGGCAGGVGGGGSRGCTMIELCVFMWIKIGAEEASRNYLANPGDPVQNAILNIHKIMFLPCRCYHVISSLLQHIIHLGMLLTCVSLTRRQWIVTMCNQDMILVDKDKVA